MDGAENQKCDCQRFVSTAPAHCEAVCEQTGLLCRHSGETHVPPWITPETSVYKTLYKRLAQRSVMSWVCSFPAVLAG